MAEQIVDVARVRAHYVHSRGSGLPHQTRERYGSDFDRWLAEHDRQVAAQAWAAGHRVGWEHCQDGNFGTDWHDDDTPNPYRTDAPTLATETAHAVSDVLMGVLDEWGQRPAGPVQTGDVHTWLRTRLSAAAQQIAAPGVGVTEAAELAELREKIAYLRAGLGKMTLEEIVQRITSVGSAEWQVGHWLSQREHAAYEVGRRDAVSAEQVEAVEAVKAIHLRVHICSDGLWWNPTNRPRAASARVGACPTLAALGITVTDGGDRA